MRCGNGRQIRWGRVTRDLIVSWAISVARASACRVEIRLDAWRRASRRVSTRQTRVSAPRRSLSGQAPGASIVFLSAVAALALLAAGGAPFTDVAAEAGLTDIFYCGRDGAKDYILEILGTGVALFDYDRDGYLDAFFTNAGRLEGFPPGKEPSNQLYRGGKDGKFTRVTSQAGLESKGWGQAACVGDFDHDGFDDLFVTYFGHNRLYRNNGKGGFEDVTAAAGLDLRERWSVGCAFLDYDLDGKLDLFVVNYLVFDKSRIPLRGQSPDCNWRGRPVLCGPRGLPGETNQLFHNLGGGKFKEVSEESGIAAVKGRYSLSATTLDYNEGRLDVHHPVLTEQGMQEIGKAARVLEFERSAQTQIPALKGAPQSELATEDAAFCLRSASGALSPSSPALDRRLAGRVQI
jgi:enediyne biosynthesis protein E4